MHFKCRLQFVSVWTSLKFCPSGNGLTTWFSQLEFVFLSNVPSTLANDKILAWTESKHLHTTDLMMLKR